MSEERNNATLLLIKNKFNEISKRYLGSEVCVLETAVDTSKVGQFMIESFKFNKWKNNKLIYFTLKLYN